MAVKLIKQSLIGGWCCHYFACAYGKMADDHQRAWIDRFLLVFFLGFLSFSHTEIHGWNFQSHTHEESFLSNPADKRLVILSLDDGTIMAIDTINGEVLWNINEENKNFLEFESIKASKDTAFVPSTDGDVYHLTEENASPITSDESGHAHFDVNYIIQTSRVEVVTLGINVVTGKLHFYIGEDNCFKSEDESSAPNQGILFIKRSSKVVHLFDTVTGKLVLNFNHGRYRISANKVLNMPIDDVYRGLSYDREINTIYGWGIDDKLNYVNCWRVSLGSSVLDAWIVLKSSTGVHVKEINLIDILTTSSVNKYKISPPKDKFLIGTTKQTFCQDIMILNNIDGVIYLQKVGQSTSGARCEGQALIDPRFVLNQLALFPHPKKSTMSDLTVKNKRLIDPLQKNKIDGGDSLTKVKLSNVKVSWLGFTRKSFLKLNRSDFSSKVGKNYVEVKISILALWKHILIASIIIVIIGLFAFRVIPFRSPFGWFRGRRIEFSGSLDQDQSSISLPVDLDYHEPDTSDNNESSKSDCNPPFFPRYQVEFQHLENIGVGGYGVVFKAKNIVDNCVYAVKRVSVADCEVARRKTMREVKALAQLSHSNIIRFHSAWFELEPSKQPLAPVSEPNLRLANDSDADHQKERKSFVESATDDSMIVFEYSNPNHPRRELLWYEFDSKNVSKTLTSKNEDSASQTNEDEETYSNVVTCHNEHNCRHLDRIYLYIQVELCHKQTLRSYLLRNQIRSIPTVLSIFYQLISAVHYFHARSLMHRDLKPSNIFFSFQGLVKVGDFGLVTNIQLKESHDRSINDGTGERRRENATITKLVGTELYMAPELLQNRYYDFKVDIYSLGLILFELIVPFSTQSERAKILTRVRDLVFPGDCKYLTSDLVKFISLMINPKNKERPSTADLLRMPLTQSILKSAERVEVSSKNILESLSVMASDNQYSDVSM
ncbi:Serine/threonine-protein kinase gcn2 [Thelohanellus kitauei]|uniref:PRKR-like endoplasmic reticulum kinase n=1 Tax=Thelohanellus kitauei TaxID=669202 RepID=A0A0C2N5H0_THEKT|nr:Serine/threonine-protein kinase gcn2 [Thelohanellus kitauei]